MRHPGRAALIALLALAACHDATGPAPDPNAGRDDFDANTLARYTPYSGEGSSWGIADGQLQSFGPLDQGVLIRNGTRFADGWVETVSSRADDGGLVLRFLTGRDYYLLAFRDDATAAGAGAPNLEIYRHVNGTFVRLWMGDVEWTRGGEHRIRFQATGNHLAASFDGVQVGSVTATTGVNDPIAYTGPGGAGVRSSGASAAWRTYFESLAWQQAGT